MADQQPGDVPAAGPDLSPAAEPTAAQPTAVPPPTRVEAGGATPPEGIAVTADVPARWSGSAAVPPPAPKRSWLARRRAEPEPDDRVALPAVDPWADQDTPWDEVLPPLEPMPPTRVDQPEPMPPTRLDRPGSTPARPGTPPGSGTPAGPPPPPPRRRWGRKRRQQPAPVNRLPVAPRPDQRQRPGPPPPGFRGAPPPVVHRDHRGRPLPPPTAWRPPAQRPLPPPPRRRRRWPRRLALLTLFGVACCCGVPAYVAWPAARQHPVTAALPDTVADLSLRSDRTSRRAADRLADGLRAAGAADVFAGVYGDRNGKRVTIAGTTGFRLTPEADVEAELDRLTAAYDIRDVTPFDAGETGLHERCGVGRANGGTVVVCAWADHGSLATVLTTRRSVADSAELTAILRSAVLTRG